MITGMRFLCFTMLLSAFSFCSMAEDFTNAIHAYLQHRGEFEKRDGGIVVGIVDEHGSSVMSHGKLDRNVDQEVNGDTVFGIYSMTITFTGLLLEDMIDRGEMKLDDPVAKYLPKSVKMPTHNGKKITLRHLVEETSGLGPPISNLTPLRADNPFADYTLEKMYAFVSRCRLASDPGTTYAHGGVAMGLLGHIIALKAGTNYETLVVDRICRPLKMDSTQSTLTPELKSRFATQYNQAGYATPIQGFGVLMPLNGLRSTADDLLKYVSAFGLTPSRLTPLMNKSVVHFPWALQEKGFIHYSGGGSSGSSSYAGFDKMKHRGVVVLSTSDGVYNAREIGKFLLESEWDSDRRQKQTNIDSQAYRSIVGQYRAVDSHSKSEIGIHCEGDRVFVQATGSYAWPVSQLLPPGAGELLPQSETVFFDRLSGRPVNFFRDARGKVTGLTMRYLSNAVSYKKISDQPPVVPTPVKPPVAIKLGTELLDAYVGHYEFMTNALCPSGFKSTIWREGDQLVSQASGENVLQGVFEIYPESETNFFDKITGAQMIFNKNDKGEVTVAIHHAGFPDCVGKKIKNRSE